MSSGNHHHRPKLSSAERIVPVYRSRDPHASHNSLLNLDRSNNIRRHLIVGTSPDHHPDPGIPISSSENIVFNKTVSRRENFRRPLSSNRNNRKSHGGRAASRRRPSTLTAIETIATHRQNNMSQRPAQPQLDTAVGAATQIPQMTFVDSTDTVLVPEAGFSNPGDRTPLPTSATSISDIHTALSRLVDSVRIYGELYANEFSPTDLEDLVHRLGELERNWNACKSYAAARGTSLFDAIVSASEALQFLRPRKITPRDTSLVGRLTKSLQALRYAYVSSAGSELRGSNTPLHPSVPPFPSFIPNITPATDKARNFVSNVSANWPLWYARPTKFLRWIVADLEKIAWVELDYYREVFKDREFEKVVMTLKGETERCMRELEVSGVGQVARRVVEACEELKAQAGWGDWKRKERGTHEGLKSGKSAVGKETTEVTVKGSSVGGTVTAGNQNERCGLPMRVAGGAEQTSKVSEG